MIKFSLFLLIGFGFTRFMNRIIIILVMISKRNSGSFKLEINFSPWLRGKELRAIFSDFCDRF